jgi:serine/threonine protein kinase
VLREVSHLINLNHDNLVSIRKATVKEEAVVVSFDHCKFNLREYIKQYGSIDQLSDFYKNRRYKGQVGRRTQSLDLMRLKSVTYQMLKGLEYCHRNGVMHRNLKPENVLINDKGTVKISDFFMSRICLVPHVPYTPEDPKERERSGREARRLWYRSPEMLFRKTYYSFDVDIWALGCLVCEMCLGEPLFPGESEIEQLIKIFKFTGTPDEATMGVLNKAAEKSFYVEMPKWAKVDLRAATAPRTSE